MIGLILAAAGSGSRFAADVPKQFITWRGSPVYLHSLEMFAPLISEAVVVVPSGWEMEISDQVRKLPYGGRVKVEVGGPQRQDSVYRGLLRFAEAIEWVLVHDAARPFVSADLIVRVIDATRRYGACIPALPVRETVKEVEEGFVVRTLDRHRLHLVQTPQGFQSCLLRRAMESARRDDFYGTDEAVLVERLGEPVRIVAGEPGNVKVTWQEDLQAADGWR